MRSLSDETRAKMSAAKRGKPARNKGVPMSEEQRAKMSAALKGRVAPNKGKTASKEARERMSQAVQGRIPWNKGTGQPKQYRNADEINSDRAEGMKRVWAARKAAGIKIDNRREYAPLSEEHKAKLAAASQRMWETRSREVSEETRAKQSAAKKGRPNPLTAEQRAAMAEKASVAQKGRSFSPEHLANLRAAHAARRGRG